MPNLRTLARAIGTAAFLAALAAGLRGEDIFGTPGRLLSEGRIFSVACHDFDGDGRPDIVVSDYLNPARVLYDDGGLGFRRVVPLTSTPETAGTGHGVVVADFNGDRRLDLFLVYNRFPSRLLFGDAKGGFTDSGRAIGTPGLSGTSAKAADVDLDGDLDIFVTYYQERARLYINDGAGSLTMSDQTFFDGIAVGDLDGDGDPDVISRREGGPASLWLNDKGRFTLQDRGLDLGEGAGSISLVDMDADGDLDLVVLGQAAASSLWENDGRASFRKSAQAFNSGTRTTAGDIDLDGRVDLVIGSVVWLNRGGGRFEEAQSLSLGMSTVLELVDIDGDGDLDLLATAGDRATGKADLRLFLNTRGGVEERRGPIETPPAGGAIVWYLGHCGYAVRTQNYLLVFDYQEQRDGQRPKSRPARPSLAAGWIAPEEIRDLKVRVFVSHSHDDHYDPVILTWKEAVPDIAYHFGWKAADDPSTHYLVGPRAELKAGGLEIATINSHHSGVPEVAWLIKVDGLVIYHNGDCQPDDPFAEHDFLRAKTDAIDLAFVFPVYEEGQKYTIQNLDLFKKFRVKAAFPMHVQAGDPMYLNFQKIFQAKFPGLPIHVPMTMGQKFVFGQGKVKG